MNETVVTVVGNVATDLRSRHVGDDRVVNFRVVGNERRRDRATGAWSDGDRFSVWVSCWRRLADGAFDSLLKGDPVVVTGRLSHRDYEVDGERRQSTDMEAHAVGADLARTTVEVHRRRLEAVPSGPAEEGAVTAVAGGAGEGAGELGTSDLPLAAPGVPFAG